jgi:hypothetical protein
MTQTDLKSLVHQLQDEIAELDAGDEDARARLQALVDTLDARLAGKVSEEEDADLIDSLRESVERFEVEHPQATGLINQIMVTLGNIGI